MGDQAPVPKRNFRGAAEANVKRVHVQYYTNRKGTVLECAWHGHKTTKKDEQKQHRGSATTFSTFLSHVRPPNSPSHSSSSSSSSASSAAVSGSMSPSSRSSRSSIALASPSHSVSSAGFFPEVLDDTLITLLDQTHTLVSKPPAELHPDREEKKAEEFIDRWGMIFTMKERKHQSEAARVVSAKKEAKRERIWLEIIDEWDKVMKNSDKLKSRVREGVPDSLRGMIWPRFAGAQAMMDLESNRGMYQELVSRRADSAIEIQLRKDITRTFPKHVMFKNTGEKGSGNGQEDNGEQYSKGQIALFNVLKAFALRNPTIGYCQGMGAPCGSFLMYMQEELAFWMLDRFLVSEKYNCFGNMYVDGFPLLFRFFFIYERLCQKYLPKLHQHLQDLGVTTMTYATKWFQLLYSDFPRETVLIIWDIFFCEGTKILFRVAIALMQIKERALLRCGQMEVLELLRDLPNDPDVADTHLLLAAALKVDVTKKELARLEHEFVSQKPAM